MDWLLGSGLNSNFHSKAHLLILFKSLLSSVSEKVQSLTFEKSDVSSVNILHITSVLLGKSLISIKKRSGPNIEPCRTPANTFFHKKVWTFETTLCWGPVKYFLY